MARHEGKLIAAGEATLDVGELLRTVADQSSAKASARCRSVARLLSGAEEWRGESLTLGGAFAESAKQAGLTDGKG